MTERSSRSQLRAIGLLLGLWAALWGCTYGPRVEMPGDPAAEAMAARLKTANAGLTRFKCLGKITLSAPGQPVQSFRAAMAGVLNDCLRIDMLAPFGGSAGTFSSDGRHLFLVRHPSGEYYKKRYGSGSLKRILRIDVNVADLLEMMVGRIPMVENMTVRLLHDEKRAAARLLFVDAQGNTRQRIGLDTNGDPMDAQWFDRDRRTTHALVTEGRQIVDGFVLPRRIDLTGGDGERVTLILERYEANAPLDDRLFTPPKPQS